MDEALHRCVEFDVSTPVGGTQGVLPGELVVLRFRIDEGPVRRPGGSTTPPPTPKAATSARDASKSASSTPTGAVRGPQTADAAERAAAKGDAPAPGRAPEPPRRPRARSGLRDAARAATGSPRPTPAAPAPASRAAFAAEGASEPATRPARPVPPQIERSIRAHEAAAVRTAAKLDALPQADRERLAAEQEAFFGTDPASAGSPTSAGSPASASAGSPAPGRRTPGSTGPTQEPVGPSLPPHEKQVEFFQEREHWVAPDGEVWHVDVTEDDLIVFARNGDNDGVVDAGVPHRPGLVSDALASAVASAAGSAASDDGPGQRPAPGVGGLAGGAAAEDHVLDGHDAHDEPQSLDGHAHGTSEAGSRQLLRAAELGRQEMGVAPPVGEKAVLGGELPASPTSQRADGLFILYPNGRFVDSNAVTEQFEGGVTRTTVQRFSDGPRMEDLGTEMLVNYRATRPDGSRAVVREHTSIGVYADRDAPVPADGALPEEHSIRVSRRGADGSWQHTNSERPSPRPTPGNLEELRRAQDELGRTLAAGAGSAPIGDPTSADGVFQLAESSALQIDAEEISRSVLAGARHIAGKDPDLVQEYGDDQFEHVRERFAELGLDASDGNEQIDRAWFDPKLVGNAYYDSVADEMVFGVMPDGTPLGMADDVIAHEFAHRILDANGGIAYEDQSGAINESLADVLAAAVDEEDWVLGEDTMGGGVRDMSERVTMDDFVVTEEDHGGVHVNSAIPNHAAYLIGELVGRDAMGQIYARTIQEHISPEMQFTDLAAGTHRAAVELYGRDSSEARAVIQAWDGVLLLEGDTSLYEQLDR